MDRPKNKRYPLIGLCASKSAVVVNAFWLNSHANSYLRKRPLQQFKDVTIMTA